MPTLSKASRSLSLHGLTHYRSDAPLIRRRAVWFALGFFTALTVAGYVAGLWPY